MTTVNIKFDLTDFDLQRIKKSKQIAIDLETAGLNPFRDSIYLVQICDESGNLDLIRCKDWKTTSNFQDVLLDSNIEKVIHFAIMDCGFILMNMGIMPENIFCTKIASKLARTYSPSHNLKSLSDELLNMQLDKRCQSSFWGSDNLTNEQLEYAHNDVRHLLEIKSKLCEILEQKEMLSTGISFISLNEKCQGFIPTLVQLWINGWDFGKEDRQNIFGR